MKENSSARAPAGCRVVSCGHRTLPRHLGGGCPGTPVRLCPVRLEATALGTLPWPSVRIGCWGLFLLQDHRAWPSWSLGLPHGFFKLGGPGVTSPEHGAVESRWA